MAQQLPLAGVVIVSTPQDIALLDVRRRAIVTEKIQRADVTVDPDTGSTEKGLRAQAC
jgi:Mrp family chromosome partitioning ATPase